MKVPDIGQTATSAASSVGEARLPQQFPMRGAWGFGRIPLLAGNSRR